MSEIFLPQLFLAATFGERPRQAAALHTCYFWQAALKVCLRSVEIFDWKD